jgi:hypothetical protein
MEIEMQKLIFHVTKRRNFMHFAYVLSYINLTPMNCLEEVMIHPPAPIQRLRNINFVFKKFKNLYDITEYSEGEESN